MSHLYLHLHLRYSSHKFYNKLYNKSYKAYKAQGFSLVEMAIVLLIAGLLLGGGLSVVASRQDIQRMQETETLLNEARDALIGYAATNGRLPCPASSTSNGIESPTGGGACTNFYDGYLPAVTLGLSGVDDQGYLRDGWQLKANRIRYAVTRANNTNAATTSITSSLVPDLYVCNSSIGITSTTCGSAQTLTSTAAAIVFSLGKNASKTATSSDEKANSTNNTPVFVSHSPSKAGTANAGGEFDDQVIWLSPNILFNRMIQAGKLP